MDYFPHQFCLCWKIFHWNKLIIFEKKIVNFKGFKKSNNIRLQLGTAPPYGMQRTSGPTALIMLGMESYHKKINNLYFQACNMWTETYSTL